MRKLVAAALLLIAVSANAAETVQGKIACLSEQWLNDMFDFSAANDTASIQAYLDGNRCVSLKGGLKVTIHEWPGMIGGHWVVSIQGIRLYVQKAGITDY
tara:strand:+ start:638 stop:937 length:300 start_codon:yes stop_codon:yes gene_type:complete